MTAPLKLSVMVPTHNRRDVLVSRTLPAMFNQDTPADDYEIVVVVDGSTDGTAEALRQLRPPCSLRIIEQPNRGPSAARNNGIQAAQGDLLLFIDDDIICGPHLFQQHIQAHADSEPAVVYGPISIAPGTPPSVLKYAIEVWYQQYYGRLDSQNGLRFPQDEYLISNSSIPRASLVACGGFDEKMTAKEDYELGLRLWKMGVRFKYLPQGRAYEFYLKPSRYVLRNDGKTFGETEVLLSRKHLDYRPYSVLGVLGKLAGWKRLWRRIYAGLPVNPVGLLTPPLWICDKLCWFSSMQRLGHRLLGTGRGVVEFRSAAREAGSWKALQREYGMRLPVLLYHHVGPHRPGIVPGLTVSPQSFESHVRWLARRGYTGIRPADWLRWRREGKGLPDKPVLFTFDDAYADLVEHAFPVLRRNGFGAAVYVVTGQVGGTDAWDEARGFSPLRLMTAEQIRDWAAQGIEFGAHSRTHVDLTTLSSEELREEVVGSGKDLESILGSRVVSFAYPYGFHNPAAVDCVRAAFDLAFIVDPKIKGMNYLGTEPHLLQRTLVPASDSVVDVECRARWGFSPIERLRNRLRLRSRFKNAGGSIFGRRGAGE
jgi:peptidoglycan/xylan/chitin deacetylase (PgdA/CDA1 family)/glycosyltransferase involved in cell wall biosynthesis